MAENKISIRFFNNKEVRAIWYNENWWFSVVDIIESITESKNPRIYWGTLKSRLKNKNNELYSNCIQLKLMSKDNKYYLTDCLTEKDIVLLVQNIPNENKNKFLDWFLYSDNTIDGQSKKKAYQFWESNLIEDTEIGTIKSLQKIHAYIFGGLYNFAGQIRNKTISKGGFMFALAEHLDAVLKNIELMPETTFDEIVSKYVEMNVAHPFMEGNGRATRIWLDLIFKKRIKQCVDWSKINKKDYLNAMKLSVTNDTEIRNLLKNAMTDKINDREIFMKGIDYSYYYEQEEE